MEFTKANLKDGMVVETRNRERYFFCNNIFMSVDTLEVSIALTSYNDDLTLIGGSGPHDGDIMKVFSPVNFLSSVETTNDLIWSRNSSNRLINADDLIDYISTKYDWSFKYTNLGPYIRDILNYIENSAIDNTKLSCCQNCKVNHKLQRCSKYKKEFYRELNKDGIE